MDNQDDRRETRTQVRATAAGPGRTTLGWAMRGMLLVAGLLAGWRMGALWRALVSGHGKGRGGPGEGLDGAGVPAGLKPPPPTLFAAAAEALPRNHENAA